MNYYTIGVDIGGTNTDVVLLDERQTIIAKHKETTSFPLEEATGQAICQVLAKSDVSPQQIVSLFFGTTHATNALLETKELLRVGLIRIAGHEPDVTSGFFWPDVLRQQVIGMQKTIPGGFECDGQEISPFDTKKALQAIDELLEAKVSAIAVVGVFSPLNPAQELAVKKLIGLRAGNDFAVSLSHEIGGIGFIERENAALLNAALKKVISSSFWTLEKKMEQIGIKAPLWMVQNDGSIMDMAQATHLPIFTIAAGQTNSFIGASKLAGVDDALVLDIGGTSTDIGVIQSGFPRRSSHSARIGGVELQFAMPDTLSLAIGGGSCISSELAIGPRSVARELKQQAQCFGGNIATLTDVGVLLDIFSLPGSSPDTIRLSKAEGYQVLQTLSTKVVQALRTMQGKAKPLPVIVVGGAASLIVKALEGTEFEKQLRVLPDAAVANAYGAAVAEVAACTNVVLSLTQNRETVLEEMKRQTLAKAIEKGSHPTRTRITSVDITPYAYSKEGLAKVSITAAGARS